jgi:branched-chain amino acid transport system ATP-binding protein
MTAALQLDNICKRFGALSVSSNVSFTLPVGARTALIGPNGAGKTTLINILTGVLSPSSGHIQFFSEDITNQPQAARAQAGLLRTFQITRVFKPLTVADNIRMAILQHERAQMRCWRSAANDRDINSRTSETLALLDLESLADRVVGSLAYGEQRLVEMALAIAGKPRVLLLDEPAAGVPKTESSIILRAIERLPRDLAILFIEHDMDLVFKFAREIIVLVAGEILVSGPPAEVAKDERVRDIYFGKRHARQ